MHFLFNCFKGIAIGSGAILPGISSGVFCVIFGIYEKLLDSVLNFTKDIKNNLKFLTPILIGVVFGFFVFGKFLNYCLFTFPIQTKSIFIGFILGSIPILIKEANKKEKFKFSNLIFFFFSLAIGIASIFFENVFSISISEHYNTFYLILCGFLMSCGIIIPGVSSTVILMLLGIYSTYLNSISTLYFPVLIPIAFGVCIRFFMFNEINQVSVRFLLFTYFLLYNRFYYWFCFCTSAEFYLNI